MATISQQIEADIMREREALLEADARGDMIEAAIHEKKMNDHLEEFIHLPKQRHGHAY
jgi:hypothetical protein